MNTWDEVEVGCWCKQAHLPIGCVKAEIRRQDALPLYTARVEIAFPDQRLPQNAVKSRAGLRSLPEAEAACNAIVAEFVAATISSERLSPESMSAS